MQDSYIKEGLGELLGKLYKYLNSMYGSEEETTEGEPQPAGMMEKEALPGEAGGPEMMEKEAIPGATAPKRALEIEESKITPEGQEDLPTQRIPPQADEDFDEERKRFMRDSKYMGKPGPGTSIMVALGAPAMARKPQRRKVR